MGPGSIIKGQQLRKQNVDKPSLNLQSLRCRPGNITFAKVGTRRVRNHRRWMNDGVVPHKDTSLCGSAFAERGCYLRSHSPAHSCKPFNCK
ncbi:jg18901 [Pararge aegeria aegeria]|uniref:Jg18901 protein n=1 Tax=Pararge aegeria aegeria TaxID=348720 RepID=A0A8S4QXP9_9NEOP|nr:jg18901 [Pararge aegeria aegeria]